MNRAATSYTLPLGVVLMNAPSVVPGITFCAVVVVLALPVPCDSSPFWKSVTFLNTSVPVALDTNRLFTRVRFHSKPNLI